MIVPGYSRKENVYKLNVLLNYVELVVRYSDRKIPPPEDMPDRLFKVQETTRLLAEKDPRVKEFIRLLHEFLAFTQGDDPSSYYVDLPSAKQARDILMYAKLVTTRPELNEDGDDYKGLVTVLPSMLHGTGEAERGFYELSEFYLGNEDDVDCQLAMWLMAMLDLQILEVTDLYMTVAVFSIPEN